jgi:hypothetical protein
MANGNAITDPVRRKIVSARISSGFRSVRATRTAATGSAATA